MLPLLEEFLCFLDQVPHLTRLGNVSLSLEKLTDVQSLSAPEVSMDAPVEGELEGPPVEA